jgi:hypothetical protein
VQDVQDISLCTIVSGCMDMGMGYHSAREYSMFSSEFDLPCLLMVRQVVELAEVLSDPPRTRWDLDFYVKHAPTREALQVDYYTGLHAWSTKQ